VADKDGEEGGADEEEEEGEGEEEEEDDEEEEAKVIEEEGDVQAEGGKAADADNKKKKKKKGGMGSQGPKWKALEDHCHCDSWRTVSIDAIISANKKYGAYWARIKAEFDEHKYVDKDYAMMPMKRSQKTMSTRWAIIQAQVNDFHGYHAELEARG
jgi:hypothetical protein